MMILLFSLPTAAAAVATTATTMPSTGLDEFAEFNAKSSISAKALPQPYHLDSFPLKHSKDVRLFWQNCSRSLSSTTNELRGQSIYKRQVNFFVDIL